MNENLKAFLQLASQNEEFNRKLKELNGRLVNQYVKDLIALADKYGLKLEEKDFEVSEELSLEELDEIAGGVQPKKKFLTILPIKGIL